MLSWKKGNRFILVRKQPGILSANNKVNLKKVLR